MVHRLTQIVVLISLPLLMAATCTPPARVTNLEGSMAVGESFQWIVANVDYVSEPAGQDYWQLAIETLDWRTGDCEDMGIAMMFLSGQGELVLLDVYRQTGRGTYEYAYGHAIVSVGTLFYDPTNGNVYSGWPSGYYVEIGRWSYDQVATRFY